MNNETRETFPSVQVRDLIGYLYDRWAMLQAQQSNAKTSADLAKVIGGCDEILALLHFVRNYDNLNTRETQDSIATQDIARGSAGQPQDNVGATVS